MRNAQRFFAPVFVILAVFLASAFSSPTSRLDPRRSARSLASRGQGSTRDGDEHADQPLPGCVTGDDGSYHFLALPAGTYRV